MTTDTILKDICQAINLAKGLGINNVSSFFKTGPGQYAQYDQFIPVSVPYLRLIAKRFLTQDFHVFQELLNSSINQERLCALFMMVLYYQKGSVEDKKRLYTFYCKNFARVNNWNLVDSSAYHIIGHYLYDKDRTLLFKLAKSNNLWKRRIAIIATLFFIRKNDFSTTLKIAFILLQDTHDLIHKAVGWMLREVGKRDKNILIDFLKKHKAVMPKIMFRYAVEHLCNADLNFDH